MRPVMCASITRPSRACTRSSRWMESSPESKTSPARTVRTSAVKGAHRQQICWRAIWCDSVRSVVPSDGNPRTSRLSPAPAAENEWQCQWPVVSGPLVVAERRQRYRTSDHRPRPSRRAEDHSTAALILVSDWCGSSRSDTARPGRRDRGSMRRQNERPMVYGCEAQPGIPPPS